MTSALHAIAHGLCQSLTSHGITCFTQDVSELSTADKVVLYVTGSNRLNAAILFDLPNMYVTTMIPLELPNRSAWQQVGDFTYDINDPNSLDCVINVIQTHCKTLRSKIKLPDSSDRTRVARPNGHK